MKEVVIIFKLGNVDGVKKIITIDIKLFLLNSEL